MQKIIQESASPININKEFSNKDVFSPMTESAILKYIKDFSRNTQTIMEQLEFNKNNSKFSYNRKNHLVYIQEGPDILAVYLENNMANDIDNYLYGLSETNNFNNYYNTTNNRDNKRSPLVINNSDISSGETNYDIIGGGNQFNDEPIEDNVIVPTDNDEEQNNNVDSDLTNFVSSKSYEEAYDEWFE
jgi:hypothetical protein